VPLPPCWCLVCLRVGRVVRMCMQDAALATGDGGALVRTRTEAHRTRFVRDAVELVRERSSDRQKSVETEIRVLLADKLSQASELRAELEAHPPTAEVPPSQRRTCAQCAGDFAVFEGGQCLFMRHRHFLCNICFGGYLLRSCGTGGCLEQEIRDEAGVVISAAGHLPCPFWVGHKSGQLALRRRREEQEEQMSSGEAVAAATAASEPEPEAETGAGGMPLEPEPEVDHRLAPAVQRDCFCGAVSASVIESILLDPRNRSAEFWRERHADTIVSMTNKPTFLLVRV
jgi:hypothetical protein